MNLLNRLQQATTSNGTTITAAGIYKNCQVDLSFDEATSKTGNKYQKLAITVTLEDGSSKTFNKLVPSRAFPREVEVDGVKKLQSEKEAMEEALADFLSFPFRLVGLVDATELVSLNDDSSFIEILNALLKAFKSNKEKYNPTYNVKIVLDKEFKYTELGRYANSTFELYKEGKESKLKFTEKDRVTAPKEDTNLDSLGTMSKDDNLPF